MLAFLAVQWTYGEGRGEGWGVGLKDEPLTDIADRGGPSHVTQDLRNKIHNERTDRNYYGGDHSDAQGNMTSPPFNRPEIPTRMTSIVHVLSPSQPQFPSPPPPLQFWCTRWLLLCSDPDTRVGFNPLFLCHQRLSGDPAGGASISVLRLSCP